MNKEGLKIDLGCGTNKKEGFMGMDVLPLPDVDYVINLEEGFSFIENDTVDEFYTSHFLEHIVNLELVLKEIHRTLKADGICKIIVPHFSNPYYYSDYTHKRFFGLYSFNYFSENNNKLKRNVPSYCNDFKFDVLEIKLVFKTPVFRFINLFRKYFVAKIFNLSPYFQEIYEGLFTKIFPCTEIHFTLKPIKE